MPTANHPLTLTQLRHQEKRSASCNGQIWQSDWRRTRVSQKLDLVGRHADHGLGRSVQFRGVVRRLTTICPCTSITYMQMALFRRFQRVHRSDFGYAHGRTVCRHLRDLVALYPQGETHLLRAYRHIYIFYVSSATDRLRALSVIGLDRMYAVYHRRGDSCLERTRTTIRQHHSRIQKDVPLRRLPRLGKRMHRRESSHCLLRCAKMGKEEHDALHRHLFLDWRYQCQLHPRSGS